MRDLTFTSEDGTVNVTYRVDLVGGDNFTVFSISGLDEQDLTNNARENALAKAFKRLNYSLTAFKEHAEDYGLKLVSKLTTGGEATTLVDYSDSDSWSV